MGDLIIAQAAQDPTEQGECPLTFKQPFGGQIVRRFGEKPRFARIPVKLNDIQSNLFSTAAAFLRSFAIRFVGQEVLDRRQQKCSKSTSLWSNIVEEVRFYQPGEKALRPVLRFVTVARSPTDEGIKWIPVGDAQIRQR